MKADTDLIIIGAGFSGLLLAHRLLSKHQYSSITILETSSQTGGRVRTLNEGGFRCEWGPECMHTPLQDPNFQWMESSLGLKASVANPSASRRFVIKNGRLVKLGPGILFSSALLPLKDRLRFLWEPFSKGPGAKEQSLADFARRRLGPATVDNLFRPMCAGIFAGDPARLSLASAFPKLHEIDQAGGIVRFMLKRKKDQGLRPGPRRMVSFPGGLEDLIQALTKKVQSHLHTDVGIERIQKDATGFTVECQGDSESETRTFRCRQLAIAAPAFAGQKLCQSFAPGLAEQLSKLAYAPICVVGLGYKSADVPKPLDGFGALVGLDQRETPLRSLGFLQSSSVFPGRAPKGHRLIRVMIGGVQSPEILEMSDESLLELVQGELGELMGVQAAPVFQRIFRYSRGIPQYELGHGAWLKGLKKEQAQYPGLYLAGGSYHGPGLADVMRDAIAVADQIAGSVQGSEKAQTS
jgi:protoporphyrinogen/coproporphyrinogen III oxidase